MKEFLKKYVYLLLVIIISLVVHFRWLSLLIFTYSDHGFRFAKTLTELSAFNIWSTFGFGDVNILAWRLLGQDNLLYGLFGLLGQNSNIADKFLLLWPWVALSGVGSYLLVKKITKSDIGGFVGSLIFSYNTYFLASNRTGHLFLSVAYVFAIFSLLFFIKLLEEKRAYLIPLSAISLLITATYDFRSLYIVLWVILFYSLYFVIDKNYFLNYKKLLQDIFIVSFPLILFLLLSVFWVLATSQAEYLTENSALSRSLFGNSFFDITRAITLFHPFWVNGKIDWFVVQSIPFYFWLIPIFAFSGLVLNRKNKDIVFFGFIALLGIFLSKQISEPFGFVYKWLFENFSGFNAYREASKFYFLIALGYSVLVGAFVAWIWSNWNNKKWQIGLKYFFVFLISATCLWNTRPIITGKIGTMFVPRTIPNDYVILKDYILKQPEYFRTYWTPRDSRWGIVMNDKPKINNVDIIQNVWKNFVDFKSHDDNWPTQEQIMDVFKKDFSNQLFDIGSVKYVIVPIQDVKNDDDFFVYYGGKKNSDIRKWYISQLDNVAWLKKIDIGTKDLVVYENIDFKPPVFAFNELFNLSSFASLDNKYDFVTNQLGKDFYFNVSTSTIQNTPLSSARSLFEEPSLKNIDNLAPGVPVDEVSGGADVLYANTGNENFYVLYKDGQVTFYSQARGGLIANGASVDNGVGEKRIVKNIPVVAGQKYYVVVDGNTFAISDNSELDLGVSGKERIAELFSASGNVIPNPSFENGAWQKEVGDCNHADNNSVMTMRLDMQNKSDGKQSLQLDATTHIACTFVTIPTRIQGEYLLTFDYQSPNSDRAGYYLSFNDDQKTVFKNNLSITNDKWQSYAKKITVFRGMTSGNLFLYAYAKDNKTNIINRYDNFQFAKLTKVDSVTLPIVKIFKKTPLVAGTEKNIFEYQNASYDYKNVLPNPSFESGTWADKVSDCNNYDNNADLSMALNQQEKSDGVNSLELGAQKHIACTGEVVEVKSGATYSLSFDYQSDKLGQAGYYLGFNNDKSSAISEQVEIKNTSWNTFTRKIKIPDGATNLSLVVYAYETDGHTKNVVRYDNFKLIKIPDLDGKYFLTNEPKEQLINPAKIDFELINPTKRLVHVKGATTPFFLAMSESYHPQWQLEMNNTKIQGFMKKWWPWVKPDKIDNEYHYKLNGFLNSWYVDTPSLCHNNSACKQNIDGSYDIEMIIEFWPQRWFYLGLIISGLTLFGSITYLIFNYRKTKWRKKL